MNKSINSYDYLRVLTTFAVVLLHTAAPLLYLFNKMTVADWMIGNAFDSLVRWCVPIFFMLSGAFLLDPSKNETITIFLNKRLNKVLIPFIVWSIIYYIYSVLIEGRINSIKEFTTRIINNDIYYHLWFLYILIGLYIITPIVKIFIKHASDKLMIYLVAVWFIGNPIFNLINHLFELKIYFDIPIDDYLGYFILGYFLRKTEINKKMTNLLYALAFISLLVTFFGTYYSTLNNAGNFSGFYYSYLSPNTAIIAIAVFILFKNFNTENRKLNKVISFINDRSFGIYLIHVLVLKILLNEFDFGVLSFSPLVSIPIVSITIFSISCFIVYLLQKIPVINRIV